MAQEQGLIEPFEPGQVREVNGERIVSYGTSSYGYDVRCADEFKIFTNIESTFVDPKSFDKSSFVDKQSDVCVIPPNSFALARTIEYFRIPRNVLTICLGKSTYARCGIIVNVTPLTRGWRRCCFSNPMKYARPRTRTGAASTRGRRASPCRRRDAIRGWRRGFSPEHVRISGTVYLIACLASFVQAIRFPEQLSKLSPELQWFGEPLTIKPRTAIAALDPVGREKPRGFRIDPVLDGEHSCCKFCR